MMQPVHAKSGRFIIRQLFDSASPQYCLQMTVLNWSIEYGVAGRTAALWLTIRVALAPLFALTGGHPVMVSRQASVLVIGLVALLSMIEVRRRIEDVLLANLGTSRVSIWLLTLMPSLLLETAVGLIEL
jgi:hypothetical protein